MSTRQEEAAARGRLLDQRQIAVVPPMPYVGDMTTATARLLAAHPDPSLAPATLRDLDYLQRQVSELEQRMERMEATMLAHVEPVFPRVEREPYADHTRREP